jgi:hypothetical protein
MPFFGHCFRGDLIIRPQPDGISSHEASVPTKLPKNLFGPSRSLSIGKSDSLDKQKSLAFVE